MGSPGRRCVLVVDDDPGIRLLLVTFLRSQGFQMLQAGNGRDALEVMRAGTVDLVVMDLMMPDLSGWDVLRERAADPSLQQVPIIIVTAVDSDEVTDDVLGRDVYAVLGKPFELDALLKAVRTCLDHPDVPARIAA